MSNIKTQTQEILTTHGLDFTIEKAPMVAIDKQGNQVASPYFGLINSRSNEVINTVKEGYTVSQNHDIVEMVLRGMERFGGNNEWFLLPDDSVAVREGGKPYIECLNCGYHTHL